MLWAPVMYMRRPRQVSTDQLISLGHRYTELYTQSLQLALMSSDGKLFHSLIVLVKAVANCFDAQ